jgi:hypothetical protein
LFGRIFSVIAFAVAAASLAAAETYPGFEVRYEVETSQDLAGLFDRPALVSISYSERGASGGRAADCAVDVHGVFDLSVQDLAALLDDQGGQASWAPHFLSVRVESRSGRTMRILKEVGFSVAGIRFSYRTRVEVIRDELENGAIGFRSRMLASLDGKLDGNFSSWFFKEIEAAGRRGLYLRAYSRTALLNPGGIEAAIFKARAVDELMGLVGAAVRAARPGK